jgi:hypothetical protein
MVMKRSLSAFSMVIASAMVAACGQGVAPMDSGGVDDVPSLPDSAVLVDASAMADGSASQPDASVADGTSAADAGLGRFSFFVTSLRALQELSGNRQGFGGDLRFGETGPNAGLRGADKICTAIAERSMPGSGAKVWRAFLSAANDGSGSAVHAIDRVGEGPWYDRLGRVVATNRAGLQATRPVGADPTIANDLPNEDGIPNQRPDPSQPAVDNHHMMTGSNSMGQLYSATSTCLDWTSAVENRTLTGQPRMGLSWPRAGGRPGMDSSANWINSISESGCGRGVNLLQMGGPNLAMMNVGSGGGYGGFYCFALSP